MNPKIEEKIKEFREKFADIYLRKAGKTYAQGSSISNIVYESVEYSIESFLSQALSEAFEGGKKEERERIAEGMKPALEDFDAAGQLLIQKGYKSGSEMIQNVGYMRGLLADLKGTGK